MGAGVLTLEPIKAYFKGIIIKKGVILLMQGQTNVLVEQNSPEMDPRQIRPWCREKSFLINRETMVQ